MTTAIFTALHHLETALRQQNLWSETTPSKEQLASTEPFCVDTLPFEQWLQWVFIPKMTTLISMPSFSGFSHTSDIHSMADYVFKTYEQPTEEITQIIQHIDTLLNKEPAVH